MCMPVHVCACVHACMRARACACARVCRYMCMFCVVEEVLLGLIGLRCVYDLTDLPLRHLLYRLLQRLLHWLYQLLHRSTGCCTGCFAPAFAPAAASAVAPAAASAVAPAAPPAVARATAFCTGCCRGGLVHRVRFSPTECTLCTQSSIHATSMNPHAESPSSSAAAGLCRVSTTPPGVLLGATATVQWRWHRASLHRQLHHQSDCPRRFCHRHHRKIHPPARQAACAHPSGIEPPSHAAVYLPIR